MRQYHIMITLVPVFLFIFSTSVAASDDLGKIYFGKNLAKPASEHTDRLYLKINGSQKLYFNRIHQGPVLANLNLVTDHIVKVYFDDKLTQSWILNFEKLNTHSVVIKRFHAPCA